MGTGVLESIRRNGGLRRQLNPNAARLHKPHFAHEEFHFTINDVKFSASGNLVCSIIIPYEDRTVALALQDGVGIVE